MAGLQSIQQFIIEEQARIQESDYEHVKKFYDDWIDGLDCRVAAIRQTFDPWFMKCYSVICKNELIDPEMRGDTEDVLCKEFKEAVSGTFLEIQARSILQNMSFSEFLELVVNGVDKEQELIIKYNKDKEERATRFEMIVLDQRINEAEQTRKSVQAILAACSSDTNEGHTTNATICQIVKKTAQTMCKQLEHVSTELKKTLKSWLKSCQLKHAELSVPHDLDAKFECLSERCGRFGKSLYDTFVMVKDEYPAWVVTALIGPDLCHTIKELFHDFINSTFIVTSQESFYVKALKKTFPKFEICMLAAAQIPRRENVTVNAMFVSEDDIKDGDIADKERWENKSRKLLSNTQTMNLGTSPFVLTFDEVKFKEPFKRKQQTGKDQKQVHEEKYRILFHMEWEQNNFWTWSLPLVVITASNQEASSLASIMWQCHATDVFAFPTDIPKKLPWINVADMLQLKMKKLTSKHTLTEENLSHLKYRLLGNIRKPMDEQVTLKRFCQETMTHTITDLCRNGFSFWKWFLGIYNLLEKYLLPYWENGLIMGFINKTDAIQRLENESILPGTFILRFSDTELKNKDGVKAGYGSLTSVLKIHETNTRTCIGTKGTKRTSSDDQNRTEYVDFLKLADRQKLKKNTLAFLMKNTILNNDCRKAAYLYAYPSNGTFQALFCRLDPEVAIEGKAADIIRYKNPQIIESVDIGERFGQMNINEESNRAEDFRSDTKRLRLDIKVHTEDVSTQTPPTCHMAPYHDIASPGLDFNLGNMADNEWCDLPAGTLNYARGLANYLSPEQLEILAGWLSENSNCRIQQFEENKLLESSLPGDTEWQIDDDEIVEGYMQSNNETIAAGDTYLPDLDDILETLPSS